MFVFKCFGGGFCKIFSESLKDLYADNIYVKRTKSIPVENWT
jgi:hypothetical protein